MPSVDPAVERLLRERRGVVRRGELASLGVTERRLRSQMKRGVWRTAGPGILIHESVQPGLLSASLIAGLRNPHAILTGPSAAVLRPHLAWSRQSFGGQSAMLVAERPQGQPWRSVRHPGAVGDYFDGLRVADIHTTLVDLLRFLPWPQAAAIGGAANQARVTTMDRLAGSLADLGPAAGVRQLRRIATAMANGAESGPEIDLHIALHRAGISGWRGNLPVVIDGRPFRPDIVFPSAKVAMEYDGIQEHTGIAAFHADRDRQNDFVFDEWAIIRVTAQHLYDPQRLDRLLGNTAELVRRRRTTRLTSKARRGP